MTIAADSCLWEHTREHLLRRTSSLQLQEPSPGPGESWPEQVFLLQGQKRNYSKPIISPRNWTRMQQWSGYVFFYCFFYWLTVCKKLFNMRHIQVAFMQTSSALKTHKAGADATEQYTHIFSEVKLNGKVTKLASNWFHGVSLISHPETLIPYKKTPYPADSFKRSHRKVPGNYCETDLHVRMPGVMYN